MQSNLISPRNWQNASVIVTGAGSGLGLAVCHLFASNGANLILVGRNEKTLQKATALLAPYNVGVTSIAGDVGNSSFCQQVCDHTISAFKKIDALINNAGIIARASTETTDDATWRQVMQTNVDAVFYMMRAALPHLRKQQGAIVNVSSTAGLVGVSNLLAYCTSKGAVIQMTKSAALDVAKDKISINAVCPGAIEAPMLFSAHHNEPAEETIRQRNASIIPHGRIAYPEEVARAILYLASERHITGTALSIDGGYVAQ